jgi:hypothetical protein
MSQIDQIRKVVLVPTPETVNTDWATEAASLDNRDGPFSLYIRYDNGSGTVNMTAWLQVSPTGLDGDWANVADTDVAFTDDSGLIAYDVDGSGMQFVRIAIVVTAGSIDVTEGHYSASQWH